MSNEYFTLPKAAYVRSLYPVPAYISQNAFYLSKQAKISYEDAYAYVKGKFESGEVKPSDRQVKMLIRKENGDRERRLMSLNDYMKSVTKNRLMMAPTFTSYVQPEVKESLYGSYIREKAKLRKVFKKDKFKCGMSGDSAGEAFYDSLQNSCKIKINSLSGTHSSPGTIGYLKSGHSTLTSVCGSITSVANATNEKLIAGNRHYYSPLIAKTNLIALGNDARNHPIAEAMSHYGLKYPTLQDASAMLHYCTYPYWFNAKEFDELVALLATYTPDELAFVVFGMDMYHLEKTNPEFVKTMFLDYQVMESGIAKDKASEVIKSADPDLMVLGMLNCASVAGGIMLNDLEKDHPERYETVASTVMLVSDVQDKYGLLYSTFFRPNLLPPSYATITGMYRRAVPLSDTDSCVFTNQYWAHKYFPDNPLAEGGNRINYTMTYFITQVVKHAIALLSMNLGLKNEQLGGLAMKNEYCFPVLWLTELAKHYYALKSAQEGNIFPKMKDEIKGVNLKNSAASADLNKQLHNFMETKSMALIKGEKISVLECHKFIAGLERQVYDSISGGSSEYLRSLQIKDEDSYTQKGDAPAVKQHQLWEEVFAPKYGDAPELPYRAVSLSLNTKGQVRMEQWFNGIEDKALLSRLQQWLINNGKKDLPTIRLPIDVIGEIGLPKEVLGVAKIRDIVKMIINPYYIVMSCLGVNLVDNNACYLYSNDFEYLGAELLEEDDEVSDYEMEYS